MQKQKNVREPSLISPFGGGEVWLAFGKRALGGGSTCNTKITE